MEPYITSYYLRSAEVDDIMVYIDGKSHFNSKKVEWFDLFVMSKADLCVWQLPHKENIWSTSQVFDFLELILILTLQTQDKFHLYYYL